ncbi:glycosyltransferase [Mucilaginibacter conchicola]|uniref:Glycosyltransferase n=1 Tax=Mucilaginibacter conchicola TaxID=2303333 RepID=A0A372NVP8_9SPHI|nr:glycosyltransferase [Mucilaginibacter conchicola]RFZ92819.1 glycosyltransferase [Mucilaginibacter conchicola]
MKKKLLISAYAISPTRGSEYAAAWNTVTHLAAEHELWVLYGMSDNHMGDTQTLKGYIEDNPMRHVHFVEVRAGWLAKAINLLNKAGFGWFFYFAYYLWQKRALRAAQEIVKTVDIDVVHQLGPIGFREPGFLAGLGKPLVWGPIGGMKIMDSRFIALLPFKARMKFTIKNFINRYQLGHSHRIKSAFKNADVLIAATRLGQQTIKQYFDRDSFYLPEQGIGGNVLPCVNRYNNIEQQDVHLVWSGSLIERKNLKMCLDALSAVAKKNWELHVLGDGPLRKTLEHYAAQKGLADKVTFHGHLPRREALRVMADAHLHIITSIGEDNPAVIFEAMGNGIPTLTIDHCGMGDVICCKCGVKVPVDSYENMLQRMSSVLNILLTNTKILVDMHQSTLLCANEHKWDKRLKKLNNIYDEAIATHNQRSMYMSGNHLTMV